MGEFMFGCSHGGSGNTFSSGVCPMCFPSFSATSIENIEVERLKSELHLLKREVDALKQGKDHG